MEPPLAQGATAPWWAQLNLGSPVPVIESYITESGCYTLLERSDGGQASERDQRLAAAGAKRVSKKPTGVADFVIVPNLVYKDGGMNASSSVLKSTGAGILGAFIPGASFISLVNVKKDKAEVTLSVTDVHKPAADDVVFFGKASKGSAGMIGGYAHSGIAPATVADYEKTAHGKLILAASLDAFTKMVVGHGGVIATTPALAPVPEQVAAVTEPARIPFTTSSKVNMREGPAATEKVVRLLGAGTTLYPTGREAQGWIEVQTDTQQNGWVLKALLTAG